MIINVKGESITKDGCDRLSLRCRHKVYNPCISMKKKISKSNEYFQMK